MSTRSPLKASQRGRVRQIPVSVAIVPIRQPGEPARWKGRQGVFRRDVGDGEHSEIAIGDRVYRVRTNELG
jgi:hypothetical protein